MTAQLQGLALDSLESFTDLLIQPSWSVLPYEHPGLIVRVLLEGSQLNYEPAFSDFEVTRLPPSLSLSLSLSLSPCVCVCVSVSVS